jgi:uncharacterized protein YkwD
MKTAMLLPLIATFILSACSKSETEMPGSIPIPASSVPVTVNKNLLLQLVNETRSKGCKCGNTYYPAAPALTWNAQLEAAANKHSTDMFKRNYFSHIGSDGTNGGMRIERAGYKWAAYGENIAAGYDSEQAVVEGWIQSPGHCKNLMDKAYKEMGVGRAGNYWTQDFASR